MFLFYRLFPALIMCVASVGSAAADGAPPDVLQDVSGKPDDSRLLVDMAVKYEHAEGVPRDYTMAIALYCRAAKLGNADAQYKLGWVYANGRGVSKDDAVAAQLFAMAAEQGHDHAREMAHLIRPSNSTPLPSCLLPESKDEPVKEAESEKIPEPEEVAEKENQDSKNEEPVYLKGPIFKLVHQLAPRYQVDPKLAMAVISVESGFNVRATSPKNAQGLMQLIPETAQRFHVKNTFDPADNIKGGLAYLRWLLAFFKGDVSLVAAAYNAGEKAVEKYRGIPPYPETQDYVRRITQLYKKSTHPYSNDLAGATSFAALSIGLGK